MANFAPGGFSTGFARGAAVRQGREQNKMARDELALAKRRQAQEQLASALKTSQEGAQSHFDEAADLLMQAAQAGADNERLAPMIDFAMLGPKRHAEFLSQLRAQVIANGGTEEMASLIPDPQAYLDARRQIVENTAQVGSFVASQDLGEKQFREGGDFVTRRTVRGQADMSPAGVLARSPIDRIQRVEQGPPGSFDARTDAQRGQAAAASIEELETAQQNILEISQTGAALRQSPRTAGITGFLNEWVGGPIGQVSPALQGGISGLLTGVSPERAAQLRTDFRTIVAQNLANITGEESGRYTTQEYEIAQNTLRTLPVVANADQIIGAFSALIRVELGAESRELMRQGKDQRFPLLAEEGAEGALDIAGSKVNPEALNQLDQFLIDAGITSPAVRDSIGLYLIATQSQGVTPIR